MKRGGPPNGDRTTLNHHYNEIEALRQEPRGHTDRHFEMFLERSRFTGWTFLASMALAVLILVKVLAPFQDLSEDLVGNTTELASLEQQRDDLSERRNRLQTVQSQFAAVRHSIEKPSWAGAPMHLREEIRRLNRSYRVLLDASPEELTRFMEEEQKKASAVGFRSREVGLRPASYRDGETELAGAEWMSPPSVTSEQADDAAAEQPAERSLTEVQLEALKTYFEAAEQVRAMGLITDFAEAPTEEPTEAPEVEERELAQEPLWMSLPPPSIGESVEALRVTPEELIGFASFRDRDTFLYEQLQLRAKEEAHAVLGQVASAVRSDVVEPLQRSAAKLEDLGLAELSAAFAELENTVAEWKTTHEAETGWYQTVAGKGAAVEGLGQSLANLLASTAQTLEQQSVAVYKERAETTQRLQVAAQQREELKDSRTKLQSRLDTIMPAWFGGVISASELIQIFPMLLILLVIVLGYNVWMVRDHFLLSRIPGVDKVPYKAASLWTLVRRGGFRTLASLVVFLGGLALLWFQYEQAAILMTRWAALDGSEPWLFTGAISKAAPWIGRTVFLAAGSAVILTLLWREPPAPELA